jgi:hypothetical protein
MPYGVIDVVGLGYVPPVCYECEGAGMWRVIRRYINGIHSTWGEADRAQFTVYLCTTAGLTLDDIGGEL